MRELIKKESFQIFAFQAAAAVIIIILYAMIFPAGMSQFNYVFLALLPFLGLKLSGMENIFRSQDTGMWLVSCLMPPLAFIVAGLLMKDNITVILLTAANIWLALLEVVMANYMKQKKGGNRDYLYKLSGMIIAVLAIVVIIVSWVMKENALTVVFYFLIAMDVVQLAAAGMMKA